MIPNIAENLMQTVGREKLLFQLVSFWRAFSLYLTSAADLNSLVLLPGGLLWMPY